MTTFDPSSVPADVRAAVSAAAAGRRVYVVGGTVRDALLGRSVRDVDLALDGDPSGVARLVADALGGHFVALDDERGYARVVLDVGSIRQIDFAAIQGSLEADMRRRDYTIDAMAVPLGAGEVFDPLGGLADLRAGLVRMTSPEVFDADALRLMRGARIACELGFAIEQATASTIRARAARAVEAAPERRRDELMRIFAQPRAAPGLRLLDVLGLLDVLLPEVATGKGVEQPKEHAYDVFEHNVRTVAALDAMLAVERPADGRGWLWESVWQTFAWCEGRLRAYFGEESAEGRPRGALVKLAGLLHDVAKPRTRAPQPDGRIRFFGHAELGADIAGDLLRRWRFSGRERAFVARLVEEHLRPVQLAGVGEAPTKRALFRFFRDLGDAAESVLFLSLADALAARGPDMTPAAFARQAAYMNSLLVRSSEDAGIMHAPRLLTGHDIMSALSLPAGPTIGRLLAALEEAQGAGEVVDREGALSFVRAQAAEDPAGTTG